MKNDAIDFGQVLADPKGSPFKERKYDAGGNPDGFEEITIGALCYTVLTMPVPDDKCTTIEAAKVAKLAVMVLEGRASLTVDQKALLLKRLDKAPISVLAKAAVLQVVDPVAYEQA